MDDRAEKLVNLMRATRDKLVKLEVASMPDGQREEAEFKTVAEAVVTGFDILFGDAAKVNKPPPYV